MTALTAALAGADSLISAGGLDGVQVSSPAKYVLDNDQIGALRRYLREDTIDDTTALMDDILAVGIGGHYLGCRSTRAFSRSEVWRPQVFQRGTFEEFAGRPLAEEAAAPARVRSSRRTKSRLCPRTRTGTSTMSSPDGPHARAWARDGGRADRGGAMARARADLPVRGGPRGVRARAGGARARGDRHRLQHAGGDRAARRGRRPGRQDGAARPSCPGTSSSAASRRAHPRCGWPGVTRGATWWSGTGRSPSAPTAPRPTCSTTSRAGGRRARPSGCAGPCACTTLCRRWTTPGRPSRPETWIL